MPSELSDFFVFGATSEIARKLFDAERAWFTANVRKLYLIQRTPEPSPEYAGYDTVVLEADVTDARAFRGQLDAIVGAHATHDRRMHVLPTYGKFNFVAGKKPYFKFTDDGFQINLGSRLQIVDAFTPYHATTRFHLFGSLLGSFPYAGDYALAMWYVNQLPRNPEYAGLDLRVYNLGGLRTRFWDHQSGPAKNPFLHPEIPTAWLRDKIAGDARGVFDNFPTFTARIACTLGRLGLRVL